MNSRLNQFVLLRDKSGTYSLHSVRFLKKLLMKQGGSLMCNGRKRPDIADSHSFLYFLPIE